jgi:hypothetical protein
LCATCLFLRVTDLGESHSSTSGTPRSRLPVQNTDRSRVEPPNIRDEAVPAPESKQTDDASGDGVEEDTSTAGPAQPRSKVGP